MAERPRRPSGRDMAWWGWGDPGHPRTLPPGTPELLGAELGGIDPRPAPPPSFEALELPDPRPLPDLGAETRTDRAARVSHAAGRSYPDLVRLRSGRLERAPDGVVLPRDAGEVGEVLRRCAAEGVAVVPFGGGTSVVGGVEPLAGGHEAVVALDLGRLDALVDVDRRSLIATLQPGLRGPEAEALLRARGLTLGHFPQSFGYATIGGFVATRSAGQASTGYGRIDELVCGVRMLAPAGELALPARPPSAAGPELRQLVVGSEGVLGAIVEVDLRVRPRPARARYEGWSLPSWEAGLEALRELEQGGAAPDVARLSDEDETRLTLAQAGEGLGARALTGYLRARGREPGCLAICGWLGDAGAIARRRVRTTRILRRYGGFALGAAVGTAWRRSRFAGPYLRDALLAHGVMAETLETAHTWSGLPGLYAAVRRALRDTLAARGTPALVACHVSHLYPSGASLYFTFLARQQAGAELEQWRAAKRAAGDAIVAAGGTITHHHAVGADHAPWMADEVGEAGVRALAAVRRELDPAGVMNPGKLFPGA